jgi:hypothetical protein
MEDAHAKDISEVGGRFYITNLLFPHHASLLKDSALQGTGQVYRSFAYVVGAGIFFS